MSSCRIYSAFVVLHSLLYTANKIQKPMPLRTSSIMGLLQKYEKISSNEHLAIYFIKCFFHERRIYSN